MFEPFSSGYYLGRMYVEPHDGDHTVMHRGQYERVNQQLYGVQDSDTPLVMKVGSTHVPVCGADGVPGRTLALPKMMLSAAGIENPPALREVLLAKADRAKQLLTVDAPAAPTASVEPDDEAAGF